MYTMQIWIWLILIYWEAVCVCVCGGSSLWLMKFCGWGIEPISLGRKHDDTPFKDRETKVHRSHWIWFSEVLNIQLLSKVNGIHRCNSMSKSAVLSDLSMVTARQWQSQERNSEVPGCADQQAGPFAQRWKSQSNGDNAGVTWAPLRLSSSPRITTGRLKGI